VHATTSDRDPVVAHILAVLSGYAYADTATLATMASRLGLGGNACVRIALTSGAGVEEHSQPDSSHGLPA
jgi:hypothetical protein